MTSNQRRPGFRLPWASESEDAPAESTDAVKTALPSNGKNAADAAAPTEASTQPATDAPSAEADSAQADATPATEDGQPATAPADRPTREAAVPAAPIESSSGFMRDLVAAMRRVAEETRQSGLSDLRTKAEEQVRTLEADAERRRDELKVQADKDVAAVGEWAAAETERIKQEDDQRSVARRAQLDQQLAAETTRAEAEAKTLRDRVAEYEQELDAYHAQLNDIADPAAFAAAAKRMPAPPRLAGVAPEPPLRAPDRSPSPRTEDRRLPDSKVHPAEEEVLTSRLAELDAELDSTKASASASEAPAAAIASASSAEPTSTEILVKGLGSFGAITGFRQALASVDGIEGVSLSLGPTGEFVFRAIHPTGFDVTAAITKLEGEAATIESHGDGGLRVTLDRAR
ncbi:MAG: hypothetical protein ABIZ57_10110 [Candidatus Limnocylindria bacterium]